MTAGETIAFFVPGLPVPGGSKRGFPIRRANGALGVALSDASGARGKAWRAVIAHAAHAHAPAMVLEGALLIELCFVVLRPHSHLRRNGLLRAAARPWPSIMPDLLKLARQVEDACTGILWRDDAQIVVERLAKVYGDRPGVHLHVRPMVATHEAGIGWALLAEPDVADLFRARDG